MKKIVLLLLAGAALVAGCGRQRLEQRHQQLDQQGRDPQQRGERKCWEIGG